jgi:very-short-patch-repair endonuclease
MVSLLRPSPQEVLSRLARGGSYRLRPLRPKEADSGTVGKSDSGEPDAEFSVPPPAADMLDSDKTPEDLAAALRSLYRRSNQDYLDRGVRVLYLAFGTLTWIDEDGSRYASPLLLVPVQLENVGTAPGAELKAALEDPVVNPALALKLSRSGIELPRADDLEDVTVGGILGAVRTAVAGQDGWQVSDSLVLSNFSFAKEAMYRDLLDHEDQIAAHPAVAALASGGRGEAVTEFVFDEISDGEIDRRAAPESTPVILDADSSQRASIAAALDGRSFVMDGPPGTGKSQTITNMIGVLLHAGKTVLFVSEKAAALDVVRDRLDDAGLRAYVLDLHSHKATRKQVAVALGTALDNVPVPASPMSAMDVDAARKRREQLNAYADAMNRPRDPLGYSLHYVLGMIAKLQDVPAAPATGIAPVDLTVEVFGEIRATAQRLSWAWRPAKQGRTFVWRGVVEQGSLDSRLYHAESALDTLSGMTRVNAVLADAAELTRPSDAASLARLLDHLSAKPPGLPEDWLTADTLDAVGVTIADLAGDLADIAVREQDADRAAGVPWMSVPRSAELPVLDAAALAALVPAAVEVDSLSASQITQLSIRFAADADMLEDCLGSLSGLASRLGVRVPQTIPDAGDLLTLARVVQAPCRPERAWLSASGIEAAQHAARTLYDAWQAVARAEAGASAYYTPAVLEIDVEALAGRFGSEHHRLGKLSAEYRADKKTVASFTRDGVSKDGAHQYLGLAVAWKHAVAALSAAEATHAAILGTYYAGGSTDWNRLGSAVSLADTVIRAAGGQDLAGAAGFIGRDAAPNATITEITDAIIRDLNAWHTALRPITAARPELVSGGITDAIAWLRAHLDPLRCVARFTHEVSQAVGHPLTAGQARYLVGLRDGADVAHAHLAERHAQFGDTFGDLYAGARTDVSAVRSAAEWARQLRVMVTGVDAPLSPAQVKAADNAVPVSQLAAAAGAWQRAQDTLIEAFDVYRRPDLLSELDDYDEARDLIAALRQDTGGKEEWHAYQACRAGLAAYGLDLAVEFCISERLPAEQVPQVIERAVLQEWAEHHLRIDPELFTVRAVDRDALVEKYRQLDRALIAAATGGIIRACNARRPRTDIGESAVIHREAEKKKKHMPVRTLIERSRHVTQAIKPCFMMSPLAVSQYLPADLHFDVVIFDEASQVSPGDAINCIYRGSALILAGDQKQLPPSNFFRGTTADDEQEWSEDSDDTAEFESILDLAKASGSFRSLTLRWHYRSLHEALIAFSNASFYEGKLITFPSTHSDGPDVGVELFWVDGTYRRGSSRDNPVEAAKVAERVIHHYDTRPALSLGVVTFSEAQAEAIETAVNRTRQDRPDLNRFFTNDRLRGFFVKSLESVQGDERDVLIFSIGYGPDENRKITMNFGPLNRQGGWRRLNVAITRARYRNEIVSSIRASDIPESVTSEGLRHLRRYLDYAARGTAALALDTSSGGDAESPFEESVITVIRSWGYELTAQVGTAGYRIDIGIRHPDHPGVYALGVECDGYQYHSSKTARDRDRLREKVLHGLGWNLHRIWGTAWYRDRNGEERKLHAAIEHAIAEPVHGLLTDVTEPDEGARPEIQTETATFDQAPPWAFPYITAQVPRLQHWIDPSQPGSDISMIPGIRAVIMTEAPVHTAVLQQRLREAWDIGRIGPRIRDNIDDATRHMGVIRDGDFLTLTSAAPTTVRTPTDACRRSVEQVHDDELSLALANLVRDAGGISHDELTTCVARLYGWTRRGPDISNRLGALIARLLGDGTLAGNEHNLTTTGGKDR